MKKEMFLILALVFLFPFVSAKFNCSDNSPIVWDKREINEGFVKTINGARIGLAKAEEFNVIKVFSASLILDAERISLSNETLPPESEFSGTKYTISLVNSTDTTAKINIGGESKEIEEGELGTIKGLVVSISTADNSEGKQTADIIVGTKLISLSSDTKPYEEANISGIIHIIELDYTSSTQAMIKVSKCSTGEILEINESLPPLVETNNKTAPTNESKSNITIANTTTQNNTFSVLRQNKTLGESCQNNSQCPTNFCKNSVCAKLSLFKRIINWFKNLF